MKIFLDTIGCRLNQAEIEILARQFRAGRARNCCHTNGGGPGSG